MNRYHPHGSRNISVICAFYLKKMNLLKLCKRPFQKLKWFFNIVLLDNSLFEVYAECEVT